MLPPTVPLPDALRGNEAGTFTADSVVRRLPEIALRTIEENQLEGAYRSAVETLAAEINEGHITRIDEPENEDVADWDTYTERYLGARWVDVPWFFAETYFYRRLLAATGYSQPGSRRGSDPFAFQKRTALEGALRLANPLEQALDDTGALLRAALWANSVDLSLWSADSADAEERISSVLGSGRDSHLLADDTAEAVERLDNRSLNVHVILDNAGAEVLADLTLIAGVLSRDGRVSIHAKPHPTFVSDVTLSDLDKTIAALSGPKSPAPELGRILTTARTDGRLRSSIDPFWVSPLPFWACPTRIVDQLAGADLVIVKGDANYRRLLGDLHWDPTTPFSAIVRPLQPTLAIRTSKSLVGAGISAATVTTASEADEEWMINGNWGMVQIADELA